MPDHQYGHGKFENFSAIIETGLLLLTCSGSSCEIDKAAVLFTAWKLSLAWLPFLVMLLSIAVDAWRSRARGRIATKYDSQALEADALHFSNQHLVEWGSDCGLALLGGP